MLNVRTFNCHSVNRGIRAGLRLSVSATVNAAVVTHHSLQQRLSTPADANGMYTALSAAVDEQSATVCFLLMFCFIILCDR